MFIYSIKHKDTGKEFIGAAIAENSKVAALDKHKSKCLCKELHEDLNKFGVKNFKVSVLYETSQLENLENMEEYYIISRNTLQPNGYNENTGYKML